MKVPQFFSDLLEKLVDKLYFLLPVASRPHETKSFITRGKISQDPDIRRVQSFYNLFLWIQRNVIPRIKHYDEEEDLKEYLNWVLLFIAMQEWGPVILNSVRPSLPSTGNATSSSSSSSSSSRQTAVTPLSGDSEAQFLQHLYNIGSIVIDEMAPVATAFVSGSKSKVDVKKIINHLISTKGETIKEKIWPLIIPQFHKVLLEYHCPIPAARKVIAAEQLSKDPGIQLVQLLYNTVCLGLERALLMCKRLTSKKKITVADVIEYSAQELKFFFNQINPFFEQLNVLFLDEVWKSLPETNRPTEKRTFIPEAQLSSDLGIKLIQVGYNLACVVLNHLVPDIQKQKWEGITDLMGIPLISSGYAIKPIKLFLTHLNPLSEQLKVSFIDTVWSSLPEANRSSKREIIPESKISQDPNIQMQQCFYNAVCFLLDEVFPKMQTCDSLIGLGWYFADQIKPLLKHLSPFIKQMKRILIDEAYQALPPEARSKMPGVMISEEGQKFSENTNTRFMQITYDCACLLLNKILPEIEGCWSRAEVLEKIFNPGESFKTMIRLIDDIGFRFNYQKEEFTASNSSSIKDEKTFFSFIAEKLVPLLMGIMKVLAPVETKILPLVNGIKNLLEPVTQSFVISVEKFLEPIKPQLAKSKTDLFGASTDLFNLSYELFKKSCALASVRTMEGNLSYQAACIIYEVNNELLRQLIQVYQAEKKDTVKKEYQLLYDYLVIPITLIQWEIKEEKAFIPSFVREFILKMNTFKNEIGQLTAELNALYGDQLKPDCCEQYLAAINTIETKKNKHHAEFQALMAATKTLLGVQNQKVITYAPKSISVETTNGASNVKPVSLKFSEWEAEVIKNVWNPFFVLLKNKKKEVQQVQAKNAFLLQANTSTKAVAEIEVKLKPVNDQQLETPKREVALSNTLLISCVNTGQESQLKAKKRELIGQIQNANDLVKKLQQLNAEIQDHEYNEQTVNAFRDATFLNPSDIFEEDKFYEETKKIIISFENELKQLDGFLISFSPSLRTRAAGEAIQKDVWIASAASLPRNDGENGEREFTKKGNSSSGSAFNTELNQEIEKAKIALQECQAHYDRLKNTWESLMIQYPIIKNSRALSDAPKKVGEKIANCKNQDLRGIQLKDKNFSGVSLRDANFSGAHLQRCDFSGCDLESVNFKNTKLNQCTSFNFKGVILDNNTQLNWENESENILLDNLSNPLFKPTQVDYLSDLIAIVRSKVSIRGEWVLKILEGIGGHTSFRPWTHPNKEDLRRQQNHAVFVVKQLIPRMSLEEVLKLSDLAYKKNHRREIFEPRKEIDKTNPYAFIRRELDSFRFTYGNTQPWKEIIQTIQKRLNELAVLPNVVLTEKQYEAGKKIMETHVEHDYGFGFFYTPPVSRQWEELKARVTSLKINGVVPGEGHSFPRCHFERSEKPPST